MFTYCIGLLVGKKIQHVVKLQANDESEAKDKWAVKKKAQQSKNWRNDDKTYKGFKLICYETDDPRVEIQYRVKSKPDKPARRPLVIPTPVEKKPAEQQVGQTLGPADDGMSVVLNPPKDVPDFKFQRSWEVDEDEEKTGENAGFDDDKPL